MSLLDTILHAQGGSAVQELGAQFGLDLDQTTSALSALVPALAAGAQQNAQQSGGLADLMAALSGGQHQKYLDDPSTIGQAATTEDGNGILGHLFGSKDVSRQVATQAAAHTGIGADILRKMLPIAATLVMGALARRSAGSATANPSGSESGGSLMSAIENTLAQGAQQNSIGQSVKGMLGGLFRH